MIRSGTSHRMLAMFAAAALLALVLLACKKGPGGPTPPPSASTGSMPGRVEPSRAPFSIEFEGGPKLVVARQTSSYLVTAEGKAWAEVRIESDRVKLLRDGTEKAKAKIKDRGFKLYDGDREVLRAKRRDSGYSLRGPDDAELGRILGNAARVSGADLALAPDGPNTLVRRGGTVVARVSNGVEPTAALLLGLTELGPEQRLAALIIVHEGMAR
jgi:hypothetical protein